MQVSDFSTKGKRIFTVIPIVALCFLTTVFVVGIWSTEDIKETVLNQFNDEQLVIAQHISFLIEREIYLLKKELLLLSGTSSLLTHVSTDSEITILNSFSRVLESGVYEIQILDLNRMSRLIFFPNSETTHQPIAKEEIENLRTIYPNRPREVWISHPKVMKSGIQLEMLAPFKDDPYMAIGFHVDICALLSSFLANVRSGKTGYAWIIDEKGYFLYHPMADFIGEDAFKIRNEKDPETSYGIINFIQKEKMMTGQSGTGYYFSGWHHDYTGPIKKLIAYHAIHISREKNRSWSVAVVAPISEIEKDVQKAHSKQTAMQSLIIVGIIIVGSVTLFFERRLSFLLKKEVDQRTEEVKKTEMKYRYLVESAEDFIFSVDLKGHFLSLNNFTASFFDRQMTELIGQPIDTLFRAKVSRRLLKHIEAVKQTGKSVKDEFEVRIDDRRFWISANFMPLKNTQEEVTSILCIARDITESKQLEIQLVNAEKLASIGTLAAGVAHEINNPLGIILGFSDILLRKMPKDSQNYEDLKTIERQGLHCKEVVQNLLSFARIGTGQSESADINVCIQEILKIVKHTLTLSHIELFTCFSEGIPTVKCDHRELRQVLLNLINNAIAAMAESGRLAIETAFEASNHKAAIHIEDNGHGIPDDHLEHIYEPFFTTKPDGKGTGLGLFVTYGIVSKYGGTIECKSRVADAAHPYSGTTFTIKLPTVTEDPPWPATY